VLEEPTSILPDPRNSQVFVSEHEGQQISVLDPILNTFSEYSIISEEGLPFGMALDDYGNLWFAQHLIDRIGLIDPENNQITEVQVPTNGSFVQWLVPDDQGRIWFAEQRESSLGAISISLKPNSASINSNTAIQERVSSQERRNKRVLIQEWDLACQLVAGFLALQIFWDH
jgi:copper transport protein